MMKKFAIGVMAASVAMGAAVAQASESSKEVCEQFAQSINPNNYPQMVNKDTVVRAPSAKYRDHSGQCEITLNYDFAFSKFVDTVKDMAKVIEGSPKRVVELYLMSDGGERALRQLIEEEYRPQYQHLVQDDVVVNMNARFTGLADDEEVENQYFDLYN